MTMADSRAEVVAAWDEGPLMRGLRLSPLPAYRAGQAIKVKHEGASAYFALATAWGEARAPELLLRRGGGVADGLIATLRPGSPIVFEGPLGPGFPLEPARGRDVLLAAAGSAIAPIRALLDTMLEDRASYGKLSLFYGQEREEEFVYAAARSAWSAAGVQVTLCAHKPREGWSGARGFVQDAIIAAGPGVDPSTAVAYLCGMPGMVSGVREALAGLGLASERSYLNF
jgi:NAD(P)H-flavin reductase